MRKQQAQCQPHLDNVANKPFSHIPLLTCLRPFSSLASSAIPFLPLRSVRPASTLTVITNGKGVDLWLKPTALNSLELSIQQSQGRAADVALWESAFLELKEGLGSILKTSKGHFIYLSLFIDMVR